MMSESEANPLTDTQNSHSWKEIPFSDPCFFAISLRGIRYNLWKLTHLPLKIDGWWKSF